MSGPRTSKKLAELSPTPLPEVVAGGYYVRGDVAHGLEVLTKAVGGEVDNFLKWLHDVKGQVREAVREVTVVGKVEAAQILGLSVAGVGRQVRKKALKVIYIDSRPRFKLTELARFLDAHEQSAPRRRRRRKQLSSHGPNG